MDTLSRGAVISCFTRLGGIGLANVLFHTARAAYRGGMLDAVICYGNRQSEIPRSLVRPVWFQPAKPLSFLKAKYYYSLKRMTLDRAASRHVRKHPPAIFHGWTTECRRSLETARKAGSRTIVERPAPHPAATRRILEEEYERWKIPFPWDEGPDWLRRIHAGYRERVVSLEEFDLADRVVVQSEFGMQSFLEEGFPRNKLVVLPRAAERGGAPVPSTDRPEFRVLFVGTVSLRKGFLDLARAWVDLALPGAELWVVGKVHDEIVSLLKPYREIPSIQFFGHAPGGAQQWYSRATVFVLPSILEGSAKTTYEAMAAGIPVIATPNAGSVVRDGVDGFIVPIRSPEAIRDRLLFLFHNRDAVREMGTSAMARSASFSWEAFERRVDAMYRELLDLPRAV